MTTHRTVQQVTERIRSRSEPTRRRYLERVDAAARGGPRRSALSCTNLAHGFAAAPAGDKIMLREQRCLNLAIVSSYNDMLSAHQPMRDYPEWIKAAAREAGATAQFAGGVPAMCDGVTQGQPGMELSLFSRDVIAMATAVALSHNMFDAALCLGVCDKIVPGLLIGALAFGHLPAVFVPAGPMASGLSNKEKAAIRQRYAAGEIGKAELLEAEARAYHSAGTCTFYGTANSNQMLMEVMGLHLPGAAFVPPGTALREALTRAAARRAVAISREGERFTPVGRMIDERSIVNAIVALLATGGSTNHTLHLVAIARAAGIVIDWDDFDTLSGCVPLLARIYPNGSADVNAFHAAGGTGFLIGELLDGGLLHADVDTVAGPGLARYRTRPELGEDGLRWVASPATSGDASVLAPLGQAFSPNGGLKVLAGNLGRAVTKVSAVAPELRAVEAPARVFDSQEALIAAYKRGELSGDFVAVVRFQGPRANGMPELHGLTPTLANLLDRGQRVALVTDGRMSGASGKVPAAIHVTPEACDGGALARVRDGDLLRVDAERGVLEVVLGADALAQRPPAPAELAGNQCGMGRELFGTFRAVVGGAEQGAMSFGLTG
jgi:phosphogluconate dehydratase